MDPAAPASFHLADFLPPEGAVHLIGCGGAGCAPLARILHQKGFLVSGSDLEENRETERLRSLGITVSVGPHRKENLPDARRLLVIHTSAAERDKNPELLAAAERGASILKRGEALAAVASLYPRTVSISGSHGKTSVTAMIAWTLRRLGANPGFLVGGKVNTWDSSGEAGGGEFFVTEGDESDGTHALLRSELAVVTNIEDDHVWSLGGIEILEENFRIFARRAERLLYWAGPIADRLYADRTDAVRLTKFEPVFPPALESSSGEFQLCNLYTALLAVESLGFSRDKILPALSTFPGVGRRMTVHLDTPKLKVMEDYAHHPTELRVSLAALRKTNPNRRMVVVFQPHRFARLERYFSEFASELRRADLVFVAPVFAAWCSSGRYSAADLAAESGGFALEGTWEQMAQTVRAHLKQGDLLCVIGAGDIRKILPFLTAPA